MTPQDSWYRIKFRDADTGEDLHSSVSQPVPPSVGDKVFAFGLYEVVDRYFDYSRGLYVVLTVREVKV